jgi:hypothetical protein
LLRIQVSVIDLGMPTQEILQQDFQSASIGECFRGHEQVPVWGQRLCLRHQRIQQFQEAERCHQAAGAAVRSIQRWARVARQTSANQHGILLRVIDDAIEDRIHCESYCTICHVSSVSAGAGRSMGGCSRSKTVYNLCVVKICHVLCNLVETP